MKSLYLKHRLVTSPIGAPLKNLRERLNLRRRLGTPELGLLSIEDAMMEVQFRAMLKPTSNCVDVGAHIGSVSYLFHEICPQGRHVIVEPSPTKAGWLRKRFPNSTVHQNAVSDAKGQVSFYENIDMPGFSSLTNRDGRGETNQLTVDCVRLDDILADATAVDLIKIDVEGHEFSVIKGAVESLNRLKPVVLFEAGAAADKDIDNQTYIDMFTMLTTKLDYDIYPVFGLHHKRKPITLDEFDFCRTYPFLAFNYFALPRTPLA